MHPLVISPSPRSTCRLPLYALIEPDPHRDVFCVKYVHRLSIPFASANRNAKYG